MKSFIFAAILVFSTAAFSKNVSKVHDYHQVLGAIKLNNACLTDEEVRSIDPVNVCTELVPRTSGSPGEGGVHTDWECVSWELKDLAYPRAFERLVCLKYSPINEGGGGECLKFGKKADFLPNSIGVRVIVNHGEVTTERKSHFTFPKCD